MSEIEINKKAVSDIEITVVGIDLVDITDVTISLEKNGDVPVTFTENDGDITIGATSLNLKILSNVMPSDGVYMIEILATENGLPRWLKTNPAFLTVI